MSLRRFRSPDPLSDEALLSIVALIRDSPPVSAPTSTDRGQPVARIFTNVEGTWPIASIVVREASLVEVSMLDANPAEKSGQKVVMRGAGKAWTIERLFAWIAD